MTNLPQIYSQKSATVRFEIRSIENWKQESI